MLLDRICDEYGIRRIPYDGNDEIIRKVGMMHAAIKCSGFAVYVNNTPVIMFDNTKGPMEIIFTVAHELGHIMLGHLSFRSGFCLKLPDSAEREADAFAVQLVAKELEKRHNYTLRRKSMFDKVKVTITREDGSQLFSGSDMQVILPPDSHRYLIVKNTGAAVESASVEVDGLLEYTLAALDELTDDYRKTLCESYGVMFY